MNLNEVLGYVVYYAPIALFLIAIIWGLIVGLIRGFRKSLILFIQAIVAAGICVVIFYVIVNNPQTDKFVYDISSKFIDFNKQLDTTTSYTGMRDVLVDVIIKNTNYGNSFRLVLEENGAYLDTLVNLAYRLILFVLLLVVFLLLVFIFYVIYLIFYPERRKKARAIAREREGNGNGYRKHAFLGGIIGGLRGMVVGVVWLSFIGALFFIVAGGTGDESADSYPDYTFTNDDLNNAYGSYKIIGSYGSKGIFRVLNTFKDSENVPYYLFAANMILSGNLNDENRNVNTTVRFTKELANYTSFVNSTLKLVLKYDTDGKIKKAIDDGDQAVLTDYLNTLMEKEDFKTEYDALIDSFEEGTYFINFGLSFVNSIVAHRNELAFTDDLDDQTIELLNIVFDGEHKITVSSLLTEDDAKSLVKSVIKVLAVQTTFDENTSDAKKTFAYAKAFIPQITKLSIFTDESRKDEFNPILQELYDYLGKQAVKANASTNSSLAMAEFDLNKTLAETNANATSINWISELKSLLDTSLDLIEIADSVYKDDTNPLDLIFSIFPSDNEELKNSNLTHYNNLINNLSSSKLLDSVLSMTFIRDKIDEALAQLASTIILPSKINYANTYDDSGNVATYGEINVLLTALKEIILNENSKALISALQSGTYDVSVIKALSELFNNTTSDGTSTLIDISLNSTVLKYVVSGLFFKFSTDETLEFSIIVPSNVCEYDSESIKTIKNDELKILFNSLVNTLDIFGENNSINFKKIVEHVNDLSNSQIIEASVVSILVKSIEGVEAVSIPDNYKAAASKDVLNGNFSVNIWKTSGEINNIIYAIDEIFNVSKIDTFDLEESLKDVASNFGNLNAVANKNAEKTKLDIVYESAILRSTVKTFVTKNISSEYINTIVLNSSAVVEDIDGVSSIKKSEVKSVIDSFNELALNFKDLDLSKVTDKVLDLNGVASTDSSKTKLGVLYSSTIIRYLLDTQLNKVLTNNADLIDPTIISSEYVKESETIDDSTFKYYKMSEIASMINSFKEIGLTSLQNISVDEIKNSVLNLNDAATIDSTMTKLNVLYNSVIVKFVIAKQLDKVIVDDIVQTAVRDSSLTKEGYVVDTNTLKYYKQSEISSIINSLKELGITSIDGIDATVVKNSVLGLNDAAITNTSASKLDVLYGSVIIKYAVAKQLDTAITDTVVDSAVKNSDLAKETDVIDSTNYKYYLESEVSSMISSLNELGITNIDGINADVVKDSVLNLNGTATTDNTKTKLNVLYGSVIIKYAVAKQLDTAITDTVVDSAVKNSDLTKDTDVIEATNYKYYKEAEISSIISSLKELNITSLDDVDAAVVKDSVLNLNGTATTDITKTKLNVLYSSVIIKYAVTKQLDTAITDTLVADAVRDSSVTKDTNLIDSVAYKYYLESEVKSIINSLKELSITDIDNIDVATIKSQVSTFNATATTDPTKTKLHVLYGSAVIKYALAERFDAVFTDATLDVHPDVLNNNKSNDDEITSNYYYLEASVAKLVDAFGTKGLGITNLDSVDDINENSVLSLNEVPTGATDTKLTTIYKSDIMAYILSDKLSTAINSNTVLVDDIDAKDAYSTNVNLYKKTELEALIKALNDLGVDDVNSFAAATISINATIRDDIIASTILFDSVSKLVFENSSLISPSIVKVKNSDSTVTRICDENQMNYLIDTLIGLDVTNVSSSISLTLKSTVNENISRSYILRATISDKILDNSEIMVATANVDSEFTDYTVIKEAETLKMLNAVSEGLGITDVALIGSSLSLPSDTDRINAIAASQVIRSTITSKLEFKDSENNAIDLYVLADDADVLTKHQETLTANDLLAITEAEMQKLLIGLTTAFGDGVSTTTTIDLPALKGLSSENLDTFLASSTILLITDKILSNPATMFAYTTYCATNSITPVTDTENDDMYNTSYAVFTPMPKNYLAINTQKDMISKVPTV